MLSYAIGLTVGVNYAGWAAVALDYEDNPCAVIDMGTRLFTAAEDPQTGESLASGRRARRALRRVIRRKRHRKERIRALLVSEGVLTSDEVDDLFSGHLEDIYSLRVRALDSAITNMEFARILIHMAQRRGFLSARTNEKKGDDGKLLIAVEQNKERMAENGYRTVGEMFLLDPSFAEHKRNKGDYTSTVSRDMVEDEVRKIFAAQRGFGADFARGSLEEKYLNILMAQRSCDTGPGNGSPYSGSVMDRVGACTYLPGEKRAAKSTYSFEYFNLLEHTNHIRLIHGDEVLHLTEEQRAKILLLALEKEKLTYASLRKALALPMEYSFNIRYKDDVPTEETEENEKFSFMPTYHKMRKAIESIEKGRFDSITRDQLDDAGTILACFKDQNNCIEKLKEKGFSEKEATALATVGGRATFGHLSIKAYRMMIPYLEKGMNYTNARNAAGLYLEGDDESGKSTLLKSRPEYFEDISSPVVRHAYIQAVKVINAIIRKQGCSPTYINIEFSSDFDIKKDERRKRQAKQKKIQEKNDALIEMLEKDYHLTLPSRHDFVKLKLFHEQDGVSPYSQSKIDIERLFEPGYTKVDHIVPFSISLDDRNCNKVLVLANEDDEKGNLLPLNYLTGQEKEDFTNWVHAYVVDPGKKKRLLKECLSTKEIDRIRKNALYDSRNTAVFFVNYINNNLAFAPSMHVKSRANAVNGHMAGYLRKRWGMRSIREDALAHAITAVGSVCTTDYMLQQVSRYYAWEECSNKSVAADPDTGEVITSFPTPWPQFHNELEARAASNPQHFKQTLLELPMYRNGDILIPDRPIIATRDPKRKICGAAHKDTIRSPKRLDEGVVVTRKALTDLKLTSDGQIEGYNRHEDPILYDALKARLIEYGGDAKKAFAEPFYKPYKNGKGPRVDKVKIAEKASLTVPVNGGTGVARNDTRVRADIYYVEGEGYYYVPIYVADTVKKELPNKASAPKPYSEWPVMEERNFLFSLYPNDLIRVVPKRPIKLKKDSKEYPQSSLPDVKEVREAFLYFTGAGITNASINGVSMDGAYIANNIGIKTMESIEKYSVDILGEYHKVKKEPRLPFRK